MWSIGGFFVAFLGCFFVRQAAVQPARHAVQMGGRLGALDVKKVELIYTAPQEFFFTQVKLAMFGGLVIAFPLIAAQIYKFVAPGLYKNERGAFLPFLIASPILFPMGAALVYFFFTPMVMWFFLPCSRRAAKAQVQISLLPKVSEYLSLIMTLIFSFGLVFQLPVVTTLMARVGLLIVARAQGKAQMGDRHRLHRRRGADAARSDQPDRPRRSDHPSLRGFDLDGPPDRAQARGRADRAREEGSSCSGDRQVGDSACRPAAPRSTDRFRRSGQACGLAKADPLRQEALGAAPLDMIGMPPCSTSNGFATTRRSLAER